MNETFLKHHGILGMKWGIRRYQPYDQGYQPEHGGKFLGQNARGKHVTQLSRKEQKLLKKEIKVRGKEYHDKYWLADDEAEALDKTKFKKLREEFDKQYDRLFEQDYPDDEEYDRSRAYTKAETEYLSAHGRYVASKMIDEFGFAFVSQVEARDAKSSDVSKFIEEYGKSYAELHGE